MKRFLSIVLALFLTLSLVPSAFAANGSPPYSLPYLDNIDGAEYKQYIKQDDVITDSYVRSQRTLEIYDVLEYQLLNGLSWSETVEPFRLAFQSAGYSESIALDSSGQEQYWYASGSDVFIILGETASHNILNEGGLVCIEHNYLTLPPSKMTSQQAAEALYGLGLFNGTGTDASGNPIFELDRTPTRHEAVTMLVRLLGKGEEATSGTWDIPFTDVADWAKPYVGYAYANGLTTGTSATTFGGNNTVTASQYLTFVLRALGYSSGTDFQWDKAWELSDKIGLTDGRYNESNAIFMRGDVAIISYNALGCTLKGNNVTLQDSFSDKTEVPVPVNKAPLSVMIEIMELIQNGLLKLRDATQECADAVGYISVDTINLVPSSAQTSQAYFKSAVEYYAEAMIKCADYEETQKVKQLLVDLTNKLSAFTAYTLTGSIDNAVIYVLLLGDSSINSTINEIAAEIDTWDFG